MLNQLSFIDLELVIFCAFSVSLALFPRDVWCVIDVLMMTKHVELLGPPALYLDHECAAALVVVFL